MLELGMWSHMATFIAAAAIYAATRKADRNATDEESDEEEKLVPSELALI